MGRALSELSGDATYGHVSEASSAQKEVQTWQLFARCMECKGGFQPYISENGKRWQTRKKYKMIILYLNKLLDIKLQKLTVNK